MKEFIIKSVDSDLRLVLSDIQGDYFRASIVSKNISSTRNVYAYTDAYTFADLMEFLASHEKPWTGKENWESLEGEFKLTAMCSALGKVTFEIELSHYICDEEWFLKTQLNSELGQLPKLARMARSFFGESPS